MPGLHFEISAEDKGFQQRMAEIRRGIRNTAEAVEDAGGDMDEVLNRLAASAAKFAGAIGIATGVKEFVFQLGKVRGEFQQLEIAFGTMLGSAEKAEGLMRQLVQTAAITPFDLKGVADGAKQLLAYGTAAEEVNETITRLGDIAAGLSIPLGDLVYLYGTTMTQGQMFTQDLRQFMGRGIPMAEELARQFGVAKDKVGELVTAGRVGAEQVKAAIWSMTDAGGKFGGLMEAQSKSITGQVSNIQDAVDTMLNDIGKQTEGAMNTALSGVSWLIENYKQVGEVLLVAVGAVGAYKAAVIALSVVEKVRYQLALAHMAGLTTTAALTEVLTAKTKALSRAMLANPYALAAAAAIALGYGIYKLITYETEAEKAQRRLNEAVAESEGKWASERVQINALFDRLKSAKEGTDRYKDAKQKIISQYGDYLKGLGTEIESLKDVAGAYDAITEAANRAARTRAMQSFIGKEGEEYAKGYGNRADRIKKMLKETLGEEMGDVYAADIADVISGKYDWDEAFYKKFDYTTTYTSLSGSMQTAVKNNLKELVAQARKAEQDYSDIIKEAESRFGLSSKAAEDKKEGQEAPAEPTRDKAYWEQKIKEAEEDLAALSSIAAKGAKGKELRDKIAKYKEELQPYSSSYGTKTDKAADERVKAEERAAERLLGIMQDNAADQIAIMEDGRAKRLAQIDAEYDQRIAEVAKRQKELAELNAKAGTDGLNADGLTAGQQGELDLAVKNAGRLREKARDELLRDEAAAMRDYIKEYGTFQQRKLAIAEEYAEKIRKAQTPYEAATLEMERDDRLERLDKESFERGVDWTSIFNDLQGHTKDFLAGLRSQIQDVLKGGGLDPDQMAVVQEKLRAIDDELSKQGGLFDFTGDYARERQRRRREADDANARLDAARGGEQSAFGDVVAVQMQLRQQFGGMTEAILDSLDPLSGEYRTAQALLAKLYAAEARLRKAREKVKKATDDAADAENAAKQSMAQQIAGWFSDAMQYVSEKGLDQLPDLFGNLGLGSVGDTASKGLSAFGNAAGAAADFMSGNYVGALTKGISAVKDFGSALGIGGGNVAEVRRITEELTDSNERLRNAVDKLTDEISDSNGGIKAIEAARQAEKDQQKINEQTLEILKAQMGYHGAHHSNSYYWGLDAADYASLNATLAAYARRNGKDASRVGSLADIYKLSPEEMDYIRTYNIEMWERMLEQGKYDKSEYWEQYADLAGQLEEIKDALRETLTQTSFDSLRDSFVDTLMDMDATAEDFADDFSEYMMRAILNAKMADIMDDELKDFYRQWADYAESGNELTDWELGQLQGIWDGLVDRGLALRDQVAAITGYGGGDDEREASSKGIANASQESVDELNGRATAIQGHTYTIAQSASSSLAAMAEMASVTAAGNALLADLLAQSAIANGHLAAIERQSLLMLGVASNIEGYVRPSATNLADVMQNVKSMKETVNDMALRGVKIQ